MWWNREIESKYRCGAVVTILIGMSIDSERFIRTYASVMVYRRVLRKPRSLSIQRKEHNPVPFVHEGMTVLMEALANQEHREGWRK